MDELSTDQVSELASLNEALKGVAEQDVREVYRRHLAAGGVCPGRLSEVEFGRPAGVNDHDPSRNAFSVLNYDDVARVLTDSETFSVECYVESLGRVMGENVLTLDGEAHRRQRSLLNPIFSAARLEQWREDVVAPVIAGHIEKLAAKGGKADLVNELCLLFPFDILISLLGVAKTDLARFHRLSIEILGGGGVEAMFAASRELDDAVQIEIERRRASPGSDIISDLLAAESKYGRFTDLEIISFLKLLFPAGAETTSRGSANLIVALLTHPDQLEAVRADRSLVAAAIEESLRWESPVSEGSRLAMKDVELNGVQIPQGSVVYFYEGSANRDPAAFEAPDDFNIWREPAKRHMAFGHMRHVCLGQNLSRLEMSIMLNSLLDRFPRLRLDPSMPPPVIDGIGFRSPAHLSVLLD